MQFKTWIENRETPVATFDFDSTLTKPTYDVEDELWHSDETSPNIPNCKKLLQLSKQGYIIYIVTSRGEVHRSGVESFVKKYNLPIKEIICTGGDKGDTLVLLGSSIHFDDMPQNVDDVKGVFKGRWIKVPHPADQEGKVYGRLPHRADGG
jgi:hypothetical protein